MTAFQLDHPLDIEEAHIDHMGHVNNAVYLNWVQEAVISHWKRIAPEAAQARYLWVALKHEITYRKAAFLEDQLTASVMLQKVKGVRAFYRTIIRRGEEVLAEVESTWCSVDADSHRPVRVARDIVRKALGEPPATA
ncbi:thioesterase [Pacificimonas flava]|uniref:Thioesterase n=2 Tax=Pacificimonas TaxID=1960290 RepID=A0A219B572_9SPHN|nr:MULTISPECIES: thioesterase family protein [Pacificimonas]MBZ6379256.1 acyl-CoA thioesterase [Pacificimonas aurantium]OWV33532.1 thioesterase [Pacificimonas flava]